MKSTQLIVSLIFTLIFCSTVFGETPVKESKEVKELKTLSTQFRKTPNDSALQEMLIKVSQKIKPPPAISEEATLMLEKASTLQRDAKDALGYDLSIAKYKEAIGLAPWWGDAYFNLALTYDLALKYDEAIATLKIYQLTISSESAERQDVHVGVLVPVLVAAANIKFDHVLQSRQAPVVHVGRRPSYVS